jgi:xylulose-5-phosphate/fructose-6-phosphate phosphoketolase
MLILRSPKGWTGPREVDGLQVEGTWRSHQVPVGAAREDKSHRAVLEAWLRSYHPEELFDDDGRLLPELRALPPVGERRMSANPHANGGELLQDLVLPDFREFAVAVEQPGTSSTEPTRRLGAFLRELIVRNPQTFGCSAPTRPRRTVSVTSSRSRRRGMQKRSRPTRDLLRRAGDECCPSTSARAGSRATSDRPPRLFNCYEAFIHIVDSMFNQHAKWLKVTRDIPWRRPVAR